MVSCAVAVKVKSRKKNFPVIYYTLYQRSSSIEGHLPSKVVFRHRSSSVKGRLPSRVVFCQRSSSVKGHLPSKVISHERSFSVKGHLPMTVVFRQSNLIQLSRVWHSSTQPPTICIFVMVHLNNLHYMSNRACPPQ